jgi:hypothetical protein
MAGLAVERVHGGSGKALRMSITAGIVPALIVGDPDHKIRARLLLPI